jgi:5-methylcytosine-specific restriction protein A
MKIFLMHVGSHNSIDLAFTVSKTRTIAELIQKLPRNCPERPFFESQILQNAFATGSFNCWGIPEKAAPSFEKTQPGDLVLFFPEIGAKGGMEYMGVVKCTCPVRCYEASRILWPETPNERLFPWLFFFDTEKVEVSWNQFLTDVAYQPN